MNSFWNRSIFVKNRINKRKPDKKIVRVVDNKVASEKGANDKVSHTNKVFTNKTNKIEKDAQEKPVDELPRWKNRGQPKVEPRKPAIVVKNQTPQLHDQIKWWLYIAFSSRFRLLVLTYLYYRPEPPRLSSPPKTLPSMTAQVQPSPLPAMVPLQENKLPSARKLNQVCKSFVWNE